MRLRLVPQETNIDFSKYRTVTFGASVVAMVVSILLWLVVGLNFGIDFRGGTTIRTEAVQTVDVGAYRQAVGSILYVAASKDLARGREYGRTHCEAAVLAVGILTGPTCGVEE